MKTIKVTIFGKVQGVFFRKYTKQKALSLEITGWVKNLDSGEVECVCFGSTEKLNEFTKWCWQGSPLSNVKNIQIEEIARFEGFKSFEIR